MQVHGVAKVPAKRAPAIGEHTDEVLRELGFEAAEIEDLRAGGAVPASRAMSAVA
jgi:formyl-CoA transferase